MTNQQKGGALHVAHHLMILRDDVVMAKKQLETIDDRLCLMLDELWTSKAAKTETKNEKHPDITDAIG